MTNWESERPDNPWKLRFDAGFALIAFGLVVIVGAVLHVTNAGYGDHKIELVERKSYNMVKTDVQASFFPALCVGLIGLVIVALGMHLRRKAAARAA